MKYKFLLFALAAIPLIAFTAISYAQEVRTILVGPELTDCIGVAPQKCMVVKKSTDADWTYFYDKIQGFGFEPGYKYELEIRVTQIDDPPADASSLKYELIKIVAKNPVTKNVRHIPYEGLCAPGFVSLGDICVLDNRCGLGIYPGKVCAIDGKVQPYLRPAQQGNAGIIADDVICAEPLQLIFKHDGSPACVKPESVSKLENRGWSTTPQAVGCPDEVEYVCGINEETYLNMCILDSHHVAIKSMGECKKDTVSTESEHAEESADSSLEVQGISSDILAYTVHAPVIDSEKGYNVEEIAEGVYWLIGNGYQTMFLTTGQGVVVVDAPQPIGDKYISAISEVTDEPVTHMIYSHHHRDHTGAAGQIFPADIQYISHKQTADVLIQNDDPNRPIPNVTFDDDIYRLSVGDKTLELHFVGNYHSNGDLIITIPGSKIAMMVDLLRPGATPYKAFAVTPNMSQYLQTHDILINDFDFDVLITGHTGILATKDHIKQNKQFALDVMNNVKKSMTSVDSDMVVERCTELTIEQWQGKLNNLEEFMTEHCQAMQDYVLSME